MSPVYAFHDVCVALAGPGLTVTFGSSEICNFQNKNKTTPSKIATSRLTNINAPRCKYCRALATTLSLYVRLSFSLSLSY